jgi:hypothetical protein
LSYTKISVARQAVRCFLPASLSHDGRQALRSTFAMESIGKYLVVVGIVVTLLGVGLMFFDKIPFLGKLPGDIKIERENFRFYFPLTTSILVSLAISAILWIVSHLKK